MMYTTECGIGAKIEGQFDDVVARTEDALKEQGFGVRSDIDVRTPLKKKPGIDFRQYRILGAYCPPLAHRALTEETELGPLLTCNIIVYETDEQKCAVLAVNPAKNLSIFVNTAFGTVAEEVQSKLKSALESLESVGTGAQEGEKECISDLLDLA